MAHGNWPIAALTCSHRNEPTNRTRPRRAACSAALVEFPGPLRDLMNWKTLEFEQLSGRELYLILRARSAVFVVEQSHVCLDADGRDESSLHVFAAEDMMRPMPILAYARVQPGDA